jgi:LmbE family N-acetylglucosaminyl deacetylase
VFAIAEAVTHLEVALRVLAVGAHPDDIEIGCGATLLAHRLRGDDVTLLVMTTGEQGPQHASSRMQEQQDAADLLGAIVRWGGFPDGEVPTGRAAVEAVQAALDESRADIVYSHTPYDTHQDHRATATAVLAATRRLPRVLQYESPTSVGFDPNVFVDVAGLVERKLDLIRAHMSQVLKNGLVDLEALEAQSRCRGFQSRIRHAEAFQTDRFLWDVVATACPDPSHVQSQAEPSNAT